MPPTDFLAVDGDGLAPAANPAGAALLSTLGSFDPPSRRRFVDILISCLQDATPEQWRAFRAMTLAADDLAKGPIP